MTQLSQFRAIHRRQLTDTTRVDDRFGGRFEDFQSIKGVQDAHPGDNDTIVLDNSGWGTETDPLFDRFFA